MDRITRSSSENDRCVYEGLMGRYNSELCSHVNAVCLFKSGKAMWSINRPWCRPTVDTKVMMLFRADCKSFQVISIEEAL